MIRVAELFRDYQLSIAETLYKAEVDQCIEEYKTEKEGLKAKIMQGIEDKKRRLRDDRDNFDINNESEVQRNQTNKRATRMTATKVVTDESKKGKRPGRSTAVLGFMLKEHEIYDDMAVFRKVCFY